jgi:DNA-binding response OmpR family regulator
MRVLVVEDDLGIAQSIQQELIEVGYVVDVASDGESGLHYATRAEYDIIILDIMLILAYKLRRPNPCFTSTQIMAWFSRKRPSN